MQKKILLSQNEIIYRLSHSDVSQTDDAVLLYWQ